ncbi:hypothetical protein Tsubulata_028770 [Turnera subulata]|uniref:CASP-like protein n=1 Tax=Turnera subulata TaxID=218843 RepID=A0A9Q0GC25_9ROSI|nr:hypothetical protein Tsubulata_028770 [Turnera subulata]
MVLESGEVSRDSTQKQVMNRGISVLELLLRTLAAVGTFGSALAMGTTKETRPFSSQFFFKAEYNDLPALTFFVIANSVVCGYLVFSTPLSIYQLIRSAAKISRIILVIFDTVMMALLTAGASAATSIVYLAHQGDGNANWTAICQQLNNFCGRISGSLIGSFVSIVLIMLIIITSTVALSQLHK